MVLFNKLTLSVCCFLVCLAVCFARKYQDLTLASEMQSSCFCNKVAREYSTQPLPCGKILALQNKAEFDAMHNLLKSYGVVYVPGTKDELAEIQRNCADMAHSGKRSGRRWGSYY
uniref:Uncharacterized protein n=1 Tax=Cacopsylla melanoneura TaxID=428564 RepID=A0A8D9FH87_9HEMI